MNINERTEELNNKIRGTATKIKSESEEKTTKSGESNPSAEIIMQKNESYDPIVETILVQTDEMCKKVNALFKESYHDYEGCIIEPTADPAMPFKLRLFFSYNGDEVPEGKFKMLDVVGLSKGDTAYDRLSNFNIMQKNKVYNLTEEGKESISEFIVVPPNKKINWNNISVEFSDGNVYGKGQKFYMAIYIDLIKFIKKIYGSKDSNGARLEYQVFNIRPLGSINPNAGTSVPMVPNMYGYGPYYNTYNASSTIPNFMMGIMRLNSNILKEVASKLGWTPSDITGFAMVKA